MIGVFYFFDCPVYRIQEAKYYDEANAFIEETMFRPGSPEEESLRQFYDSEPDRAIRMKDHVQKMYGGMWRYNEIVGWIRLHFLGSQIRGEYYQDDKKRLVRSRRKTFAYRTWKLAPELELPWEGGNNQQIYATISRYLDDCRRELNRRHVDSSLFEAVGPYIDWMQLHRDYLNR